MKFEYLNGVKIFVPESREELIKYALQEHQVLVAVNAEKILHATSQSRELINNNLGYPDGAGAVWALQKKGWENSVKIPGCELWLDIINQYFGSKTFYLIGGEKKIIEGTIQKLRIEYPGIKIINYRDGYIKSEEEEKVLIQDIKELRPDIVFVAMGSPKQELLMQEMQKQHAALYQGLGGSFDVYTGMVKRAPKWWVKNHLEWAYRLFSQPSRIKRQIHLVRYLFMLQMNKL